MDADARHWVIYGFEFDREPVISTIGPELEAAAGLAVFDKVLKAGANFCHRHTGDAQRESRPADDGQNHQAGADPESNFRGSTPDTADKAARAV